MYRVIQNRSYKALNQMMGILYGQLKIEQNEWHHDKPGKFLF